MNTITEFLISHGAPILFAAVFADQAGLPLPAAPWLLAAGALAAGGQLNPILAVALTVVASLIADSAWFYIGRRGGKAVLRFFCRLSLAQNSCVERTKGFFARHGLHGLIAAKFLPGLGAVMPPLAGALGMSTTQFFLFDGLGSLIYATFYVAAGYVFRNQLRHVVGVLDELGFSALIIGLLLASGYITYKFLRRRHLRRSRQEEVAAQVPATPALEQSPCS